MAPELQAQFPEIRSFAGQGIDDPSAVIRFSISPEKGLSSFMRSINSVTLLSSPMIFKTMFMLYIIE